MFARTLTLLTVIYLFVETQAWVFLSKIYTSTPLLSQMALFERFGYASAGLGITLLFAKWVAGQPQLPTRGKGIIALSMAPFVYLFSVWAVYEVVQRSPAWIPDSARPHVMTATLQTLAEPQWRHAAAAFSSSSLNAKELAVLAKKMDLNYPVSDLFIQRAYIEAFKSIDLFSDYYLSHAETLDRQLWAVLWQEAKRARYALNRDRYSRAFVQTLFDETTQRLPSHSLSFADFERLIVLHQIQAQNPAVYTAAKQAIETQSSLSRKDALALVSKHVEYDTWAQLGDTFDDWPHYRPEHDFFEQLQRAYSFSVLNKYTYMPDELLRWHRAGSSPFNSPTYHKAMMQLTPFLFDQNGMALINITQLRKKEVRTEYIRKLQGGLPRLLRDNWQDYRARTLVALASSKDAWLYPTDRALHQDLLRIGVITPVLLLLSLLLIALNLYGLFKTHLYWGVAGMLSTLAAFFELAPPLTKQLLESLVIISVREAKIFLL